MIQSSLRDAVDAGALFPGVETPGYLQTSLREDSGMKTVGSDKGNAP
jgi:hypothetical protein